MRLKHYNELDEHEQKLVDMTHEEFDKYRDRKEGDKRNLVRVLMRE